MKFVTILKDIYKFRINSGLCFIYKKLLQKLLQEMMIKIHIHCLLADSSIMNGNTTSDLIGSFLPKTEPGMLLCEIPIER